MIHPGDDDRFAGNAPPVGGASHIQQSHTSRVESGLAIDRSAAIQWVLWTDINYRHCVCVIQMALASPLLSEVYSQQYSPTDFSLFCQFRLLTK